MSKNVPKGSAVPEDVTGAAKTRSGTASSGRRAIAAAAPSRPTKAKKSMPNSVSDRSTAPKKTRSAAAAKSGSAAKTAKAFKPVAGQPLTEQDIRKMSDADYMCEAQLQYFRDLLLQQRKEVLDRQTEVKERLHQRETFADPADRATAEEEHWLDLRLRERESLLLRKIDESLRRIAEKEYGYCEVTGEAIGIPRLLARPTATVCVDVKGQNEQIEAQYRDR